MSRSVAISGGGRMERPIHTGLPLSGFFEFMSDISAEALKGSDPSGVSSSARRRASTGTFPASGTDSTPAINAPELARDGDVGEKAEALMTSLRAQEAHLLALGPNWDGYGAAAISPTLVRAMVSLLVNRLPRTGAPAPDIIPGADGSLQAEWHLENVQLTYSLGENGFAYTWVRDRNSGVEHEYFDPLALEGLLKWLPALAST